MFFCRRLGEGAGRAEIGDTQGLLECKAGRHDLAEDRPHSCFWQWAGVGRGNALEYLSLALGAVEVAVLYFTNTMCQLCALGEQLQHVVVDRVDTLAQSSQFFFRASHVCVRIPSCSQPGPARLPAAWRYRSRPACRPPTCGL